MILFKHENEKIKKSELTSPSILKEFKYQNKLEKINPIENLKSNWNISKYIIYIKKENNVICF